MFHVLTERKRVYFTLTYELLGDKDKDRHKFLGFESRLWHLLVYYVNTEEFAFKFGFDFFFNEIFFKEKPNLYKP